MKKLILVPLLVFAAGCSSLHVTTETGPDGKTVIRKIDRYAFASEIEFQSLYIPGLGKLSGYQNDGGKGALEEAGNLAEKITEGAVRGALKAQGK
jgi:hypothetical protein